MQPHQAAKNALQSVLQAKKGEKIVIFCDDNKKEIGEAFQKGAQALHLNTELIVFATNPEITRREIPQQAQTYLTTQRPQIYINLLSGNREETPFRIKLIHKETEERNTRLGHCPGVTIDMLTQGALALSAKEHRLMQAVAKTLMKKLKKVTQLKITTPAGTELTLSTKQRPFYTDTKLDWKLMKWMNLPTGEVIVAPVEDSLEGKLVCDMAIGGIGPVKTPVTIKIKEGKVDAVTSESAEVLKRVQNSLHTDAMAKVVGEFAFGINPKARFVEEFLETEKMLGTIHIAFGDNTDMPGGKNNSANHMDFMMDKPTVDAITSDGSVINIMANGKFVEEKSETKSKEEKLPISEFYKVIDYKTIFKTDLWWEAIVVFEAYGKPSLGFYLWQKRNGAWKRKNKFAIRNLDEWNKLKNAVDILTPKLTQKNPAAP